MIFKHLNNNTISAYITPEKPWLVICSHLSSTIPDSFLVLPMKNTVLLMSRTLQHPLLPVKICVKSDVLSPFYFNHHKIVSLVSRSSTSTKRPEQWNAFLRLVFSHGREPQAMSVWSPAQVAKSLQLPASLTASHGPIIPLITSRKYAAVTAVRRLND